MDTNWKSIIWRQFGAAIDMLENAITACPDDVWNDRSRQPEYWYLVYHTLFFLDFYLTDAPDSFAPPAPFGLEELDPAGVLPPRVYTKAELRAYLQLGRKKCLAAIAALVDADLARLSESRPGVTIVELLFYSLRHVQHHAAQLNLLLRQTTESAPRWVSVAKDPMPVDER